MLGFIAKFQVESPYVGFTSGLITMIVFSVSKIGIYKYGTANKNFGYELHLSRIDTLTENSNLIDEWKTRYLKNRKVLERGLLSIHSCGILWQAIVVAHYRALDFIQKENGRKTYRKYTNVLK